MAGKSSRIHFIWLMLLMLALSCLLVTGCGSKTTGDSTLTGSAGSTPESGAGRSTPGTGTGSTTPTIGAGGSTPMNVAVGTLHGTVTVSPVCPVETPDDACRPRPLANRQVQIKGYDGQLFTMTTDQQGQFSIQLHPGRYLVEVQFVSHPMRQRAPLSAVFIVANQTTEINIPLDTGIR